MYYSAWVSIARYIGYGTGATLDAVELLAGKTMSVKRDEIPAQPRVAWDRNRDDDSIECSMSAVGKPAYLADTGRRSAAELVRRIGSLATEVETRMSTNKQVDETQASSPVVSSSSAKGMRLRELRTYKASTSESGAVTALQDWIQKREGVRFGDNCVGRTRLLWQAGHHWALSDDGVSLTTGEGPQSLLLSVRVRKDPGAENEPYVLVELLASDVENDEVIGAIRDAMDRWWSRYERHKDKEAFQGELDALEAKMRDCIDSRLRSKHGEDYWATAVPDEVRKFIHGRIGSATRRQPYLRAESLSMRERLDYCDISHYEKLIEKNWDVFESVFGDIPLLQQNLGEWADLRNSLMHTRKPTIVEELRGEAAIRWLHYAMDASVDAKSSTSSRSNDMTAAV